MSGRTDLTKRSAHLRLVVNGLGQPQWTSTVQKSHHPGKPLWNLWTSRPLGRGHIGRNPWTQRSAHGLMGSYYWLGQQSPSGQNMEDSCGNYSVASSIWYTNLGTSRVSLWPTPRTSRHRT